MKLIIDISEEDYKECKFRNDLLSLGGKPTDLTFNMRMETLIAEGTPLQTELEEIKAEIGRIETEDGGDFLERPAIDIIYESQRILDKHIKEIEE